jgi:hypothetical protein
MADLETTIRNTEWRAAMGVSEGRLQELVNQAVDGGFLEETLVLDEPLTSDNEAASKVVPGLRWKSMGTSILRTAR